MMKEPILLIGGGGHCRALIDVIEQENTYEIAGIIDQKERIGESVMGYPVLGCDDDLPELHTKYKTAVVSVGHIYSNATRIKLFTLLQTIGYRIPVIVSPTAYVSKHALIAEGSVIMHHALVNAGARVGKNCIINSKALIEHDVVIENHCHVSTGAILNGGAIVRENSFIGSNAVSKEYAVLSGFIKAGSVVT
jgi:sugar O-acyltransferase (sialic acid O-acetyltransferase NeuD family)